MLVTGATDGIGEEVARQLAARGATMIVHGRSAERVDAARDRIGGQTEPAVADLASRDEVRALVDEVRHRHDRLDALVNNAGVGFGTAPSRGARTADGHEVTWQINFLSAFALTLGLCAPLAEADGGRVINVSSGVHSRGEVDLDQPDEPRAADPYGQSKIALVMFARELADRWRSRRIDVNACSPGWIATKMGGAGGGRSPRAPTHPSGSSATRPSTASPAGTSATAASSHRTPRSTTRTRGGGCGTSPSGRRRGNG